MPVRATTSESKGFLNFMEVIEYYKNLDLTNIVYTKEMSIKYGVCEKYISAIMNRKRWTHLP